MSAILVVNSGSSSFKYQLIEIETEKVLASGLVERIGEASGHTRHTTQVGLWERELPIADHSAGFAAMLEAFAEHGPDLEKHPLAAVGHRVVHGGKRFHEATVVTDLVKINIEDLSELAPLHNPANLQGIDAAQKAFPSVPQVAVFDTAFHQTLAPEAYTYAIDAALAEKQRVRRYGFHGTSHKFVAGATAEFLGRPLSELKLIVLHLGNGASVCAIDGGRSVETSMGMTPLEGLVMGTRSGDLDPAVLFHLHRKTGMGFAELDELLNRRSGLLGISGRGDMRDVQKAAGDGDEAAQLALDVYLHRIRGYIGSYYAQLGHLDAIVFTAGVGENNAFVRGGALAGLSELGIEVDQALNTADGGVAREARRISADSSRVSVLVVPTNEELEIARQAFAAVSAA
ncbi:acetate kinase [Herbiconiux moechotypicola]|uniref:Acetate kinase n=1 Tax=Herbiconiux moechotypicola TaxID=637393 RepID=A0ABP5QLU6_9MICO|nr:acetate kinase [Herbiconiux moechotypicola]MCS5731453.1 acetate kinase [Herbiconiux moechotypicola]